jgi:DNA sulfur modification protein DndE
MMIGLDEIATAAFRTNAEADQRAQRLKDALGFGAFYVPARLAIGRSLAITHAPPPAGGAPGRPIPGGTLFGVGEDLATWVSLLIEHTGRAPVDLRELQALVAAHWARGLDLLAETFKAANNDPNEFWQQIARAALPEGGPKPTRTATPVEVPAAVAIEVPIGPTSVAHASGEPVVWHPNAGGGSPHAALMGGVGSGKTRTAAFMLREIRRQTPVPLLAFDFKGDMTDEHNALDRTFEATVLAPPHQPIPLDVLALADRADMTVKLAAQRLLDSLTTLKGSGFGAQQKDPFVEAAERALRMHRPCAITDVRDALIDVYAERQRKEDGAVMTLRTLCRLPLFTPDLPPAEFFRRSWIVRLSQDLPDLVRVTIVTLVTDALDRWLNGQPDAPTDDRGNRALCVLCAIDEAHRILGARLPGLSGLIRLSRSKGGAIMLISQSPDDFSGEDDEFLDQMGLVAAFATNADARAMRRIFGPGANLATLGRGEAWLKLRGEAARRIVAWRDPTSERGGRQER